MIVNACKTGALKFKEINQAMHENHLVAIRQEKPPEEIRAWRAMNAVMAG
jgi:hypothetical protein